MFDLAGRVALVTGASRGLGLAIAENLARVGAKVWLNSRNRDALLTCVEAISAQGGKAEAAPFDVADSQAAEAAIHDINEIDGGLDILVNNVGARDRRALFDFDLPSVRTLLETDLLAPFQLSRLAAAGMIRRGRGGRIINISSVAGPLAQQGDTPYTMAKAGVDGLTRALAAELGPHGITVNAVAPGFFKTEPNAAAARDPKVLAWLQQRTSLRRWGEPQELAPAVVFLASREAGYVTGQVLAVDGGMSSHF